MELNLENILPLGLFILLVMTQAVSYSKSLWMMPFLLLNTLKQVSLVKWQKCLMLGMRI